MLTRCRRVNSTAMSPERRGGSDDRLSSGVSAPDVMRPYETAVRAGYKPNRDGVGRRRLLPLLRGRRLVETRSTWTLALVRSPALVAAGAVLLVNGDTNPIAYSAVPVVTIVPATHFGVLFGVGRRLSHLGMPTPTDLAELGRLATSVLDPTFAKPECPALILPGTSHQTAVGHDRLGTRQTDLLARPTGTRQPVVATLPSLLRVLSLLTRLLACLTLVLTRTTRSVSTAHGTLSLRVTLDKARLIDDIEI